MKKNNDIDEITQYKKYKNNSIGMSICLYGFWTIIAVNIITYVLSETIWEYSWTIGLSTAVVYLITAASYMRFHNKKLKELKIKAFGEPEKIEYSKMFKEIWQDYDSEDLEMLQIFIKGEKKFITDDNNNIIIVNMDIKKNKITINFENFSAIMIIKTTSKEESHKEYVYENYKDIVDLFNEISTDLDKLKQTKKHN